MALGLYGVKKNNNFSDLHEDFNQNLTILWGRPRSLTTLPSRSYYLLSIVFSFLEAANLSLIDWATVSMKSPPSFPVPLTVSS